MSERILLTGGAGFIGSHLARALHARGDDVTVLDDLSTGRASNLTELVGKPRFQFVSDTVESEQTVNLLVSRCDRIFHLASAVGVQLIVDQPVRTIKTIIRGTEVVLEAAQRFNKPVLITSSSEVYGKGARVPFREDDDVVMGATRHNRWCYAYAKGIDEFLGLAYHHQFGLPVTLVRLFNTVGPKQVGQYGMVLPRFVQSALAGDAIQVYGDGTQTRCFCHVNDVVDALIELSARPESYGQVYNLGSDEEVSINELAGRVINAAGSTSVIRHIPYGQIYGPSFDDLPRRVPDLSKIRTLIGFRPRHELDGIIRSVVDAGR